MTTIETPSAGERTFPQHDPWLNDLWDQSERPVDRRRQGASGVVDSWREWVRHVEHRRTGTGWPRALAARRSPLWWSLAPGRRSRETTALLAQLDRIVMRGKRPRGDTVSLLRSWLDERPPMAGDSNAALEALAWCHAMPAMASVAPAELWWTALRQLAGATRAADATCPAESPLVHQLLAGELPLALAYRFPELKSCRGLAETARPVIEEGLRRLLDEAAMVHACQIDELVPLVGCWTRVVALWRGIEATQGAPLADDARQNFARVVRNLLRFVRRDGSWLFVPIEASAWRRDLLPVALRHSGDARDRAAARTALPRRAEVRGPRRKKLREPSLHAEEAGVALLRTSWSRGSELVGLTFGDEGLQLEFTRGGDRFFEGTWGCRVWHDDRPVRQTDAWQSVCWLATKDAVYLELVAEFEANIKVERQIVLARRDRFLYLADAVLGAAGSQVSYESRLPLAVDVDLRPGDETCEAHLVGCESEMLLLPLARPEWRSQPSTSSFERDESVLKVTQSNEQGQLYAPLFIDLDRRRSAKRCTWRQLTVAENRVTLAPHAAVGYRVQVGQSQWLFYRSLAPVGNRTLLGQNLVSEFLAARFTRQGTSDPIVEIE